MIESGTRLHFTEFEWPKNPAPSGFSMKLRKHINNKRLEKIQQMGVDRVVDMQFGSDEAAYHLILEMYDRGNLVLTDHEYKIMNILRPRVAGEEKFLVRETYPVELAKQEYSTIDENNIKNLIKSGKPTDTLKKILMPQFDYGPSVLEHVCLAAGIQISIKLKEFNLEEAFTTLFQALTDGVQQFFTNTPKSGIIVEKRDTRVKPDGGTEEFFTFQEFHPYHYKQFEGSRVTSFPSFNSTCDTFFSQIESQKMELKTVQQEKSAMKKLENVKKDHEARIKGLQDLQAVDRRKGELIEMNSALVDNAIKVIVSALANQIPWDQIKEIIKEATENGDPVASRIKQLKFEVNHVILLLTDPYLDESSDEENESENEPSELLVEIDLDLSAQANARKYFSQKKQAASKEVKTKQSGSVALKSAEKKTKQSLKEIATITNINKARKVYWFEKFFWFISSENFLVIGGRDAQQNELIVKRYMKSVDVYVHADLHGAASIVIKNPTGNPVPPKTLNEAAQFSVCFSAAWDSKVITSAYWVNPEQVSKTAPSGEYLTLGSFMIRGKKNYMPPSHLIMGFGFLFKLEDSSIERHKDERKIRGFDDTLSHLSQSTDLGTEADLESVTEGVEDVEINVEDGESSEDEEKENKLQVIPEDDENQTVIEKSEEIEEKGEIDENESEDKEDKEDNNDKVTVEDVKEEGESEGEMEEEFPDTDVKIEFNRSGSVEVKTKTLSSAQPQANQNKSQNIKGNQKQTQEKGESKASEKEQKEKQNQSVRGKKGKLKKQKDKYKDQDEEDRQLAMAILQSDGKEREKKKKGKQKGSPLAPKQQGKKSCPPRKPREAGGPAGGSGKPPGEGASAGDVEEEKVVNDETDMLDSLTGIPVQEDELLFAVPVCAPYNTLVNFKFKVKLTPGTGKRGKSCKTALAMFIADKSASSREKDLFKSVKDQDLARNLPGKVKLSAPHLQRIKGKK